MVSYSAHTEMHYFHKLFHKHQQLSQNIVKKLHVQGGSFSGPIFLSVMIREGRIDYKAAIRGLGPYSTVCCYNSLSEDRPYRIISVQRLSLDAGIRQPF